MTILRSLRFLPLLALTLSATAASVRAGILTQGNFQTGTPTPTLTISAPITFTITGTSTSSVTLIDLDDWVTSDGSVSFASSSAAGRTLSYQIDGGAIQTVGISSLLDNYNATFGSFTPNDGLISLSNSIAVTAGQTLTFLPGTVTFASGGSGFNTPPANFTGNVFLASGGTQVSNLAPASGAVPEPSTWAFVAAGAALLGVTLRGRRRHPVTA